MPVVARLLWLFAVLGLLTGCSRSISRADRDPQPTADNVLHAMVDAYQNSRTYHDAAVVRLQYQRDGRTYQDEAPVSVCWIAPNQLRVRAYQVELVSDGTRLTARIRDEATKDFDSQVVDREAPAQMTLSHLYEEDEILDVALRQGLVGYPPQLDLLLSPQPLQALLDPQVTRTLRPASEVNGRTCHGVEMTTEDGSFVLWIDRDDAVLRRVEFPATAFAPDLAQDASLQNVQLTIEFLGATFAPHLPADTFATQVDPAAKRVRKFIPPPRELPSRLFGQTTSTYAFTDLSGNRLTAATAGDRVKVFLWFGDHPACQSTVEQLNQVFTQYQAHDRVAIHAICTEPSSYTNDQVTRLLQRWRVQLPVARDLAAVGRDVFQIPWAPTIVVLDSHDVVQIVEVGANPNLVAELPQVLERLLAGDDLASEILAQYADAVAAYHRALERGEPDPSSSATQGTPIAPANQPQLLQLRPLWELADLKASGNLWVIDEASETTRILALEGWQTVVEIDPGGTVKARHTLDLPPNAGVTQIQSAVDRGGHRYYALWALRGPQLHVFDARWKRIFSYPDPSLAHEGVQDVALADLAGEGHLVAVVGFWGTNGVHCVSTSGKSAGQPLWINREVSHIYSLLATPPQHERPTTVWVANAAGAVHCLGPQGNRIRSPELAGQPLHHVFSTREKWDAAVPFCAIAYGTEGRRLALGLTPEAHPQWRYTLPAGSFPSQVRFVTSAPLLADHEPLWLIGGTDGSLHMISSDGRFTDHFQTGSALTGIAGTRYGQQRVLIVSTPTGVKAWEVLPPATAARTESP